MNKQYRVKKSNEIEDILNNKDCFYNPFFSVYKLKNPKTSHLRYAISVGKKLGKAVVRNRIKRQITAILDEINIDSCNNVDVFIIARVKVLELDYNSMLKQLRYLFKKHKLIKGDKND
jgi:ribonuclease P protein component